MIASVATYPHEVLRTRLQIQKYAAANITAAPYEGIGATFQRILREEGYIGLYRGMGVNLLRTVPASALTILTYACFLPASRSALTPPLPTGTRCSCAGSLRSLATVGHDPPPPSPLSLLLPCSALELVCSAVVSSLRLRCKGP